MAFVNVILVGSGLLFLLGVGMTIVGRALVRAFKATVIDFRTASGHELAKGMGLEN